MATPVQFSELEKGTIDKILREKIEKCFVDEKLFKNERVKRWTETISRECLRDLVKLQKPYKFIVSCSINQRTGGALIQHASCYADPLRDIITTIHWKNDFLHCILTVYALVLF